MKVIFVSSGNNKNGISPIIKNQGVSLQKEGLDIDYFTINGSGIKGYIQNIPKLREYLKNNQYDIVHAHYWLSAIVASLAGAKPLVVSLMGDDVKAKRWFRWIITIFHYLSWSKTIVKSKDMYLSLGIYKNVYIVPNGVDLDRFRPISKDIALKETGWDSSKKHILFTSNPNRVEKNFALAKEAFDYIDDDSLELHYLKDVANDKMPYYYNASDVVILTSFWEGSPNAIKEAMACNIPIVSTRVGDVEELILYTNGCYISNRFDYKEFALIIIRALKFGRRTNGREAIKHLKSEIIAKDIIDIYKDIQCVEL